jgi:NADPH2:quinone reductase
LPGTNKIRSASVSERYAPADAAQAHRDLEARKTIGSVILTP